MQARIRLLKSSLRRSPLSQLFFISLISAAIIFQLGRHRANAGEPSGVPLHLQKLKLEKQQRDLLKQGVASELVFLRSGAFALWIKPSKDSKENLLAAQLKKKLGISLFISPETIRSSVAAFSNFDKGLYLHDALALRTDFDLLLHEVRHAKFTKQITSANNDMFQGYITRNVVYEPSDRVNYFKKGMHLDENFTFPYELRLNLKTAFDHPSKTDEIIRTGMEINQFTLKVLTELSNEVNFDVSKVELGIIPASDLGGSSKDLVAGYIIQGKNFKLKSFISGVEQGASQQQMVDALKQSLKRKIDYYTEAREHWNKVQASFKSNNAEDFSRDVKELISRAREHLQPLPAPVSDATNCVIKQVQSLR